MTTHTFHRATGFIAATPGEFTVDDFAAEVELVEVTCSDPPDADTGGVWFTRDTNGAPFACPVCGRIITALDALVVGERYRVTMKIPGVWNTPRVAVMHYLGARPDGALVFDLRPVAGTQLLKRDSVVAIEPTTEPLTAPREEHA